MWGRWLAGRLTQRLSKAKLTVMTFVQRFFSAVLPHSWATAMQAESRSWMVRCTCGYERSVWELGGIRWKAKGSPRRLMRCPQCGENSWHTVYRPALDEGESAPTGL